MEINRTKLILATMKALKERHTYAELANLFADSFPNAILSAVPGGSVLDPNPYLSKALRRMNDNGLLRMAKDNGVDTNDFTNQPMKSNPPLAKSLAKPKDDSSPVKAFISHSTKNKKIAMAFRTVLKKYDIIAFVSGKDIKGGQPWQKTIRKEIDNMDIFIAIHTQAFSKSLWCQQETGMALKRENEIEIIPINVGMRNAPESFLTNFQYIKSRGKSTEEVVREFFETLKESEKTKKLYLKRIEPKVKQVDKDAKEAIDKAWTKRANSIKNKIDKHLPSATATGLDTATGGLVSNHGSATGDLVSRHASAHGSAYRKKSNQPRLPVTYPDELL